jgi:hypothetical protein
VFGEQYWALNLTLLAEVLNAVKREPETVAWGRRVALRSNRGALPAVDKKGGEQIRVHFRVDLPLGLG